MLEVFDALCSTDEVLRGKEYSDVFELAAYKVGVQPKHCIVFDDVLPAIKAQSGQGCLPAVYMTSIQNATGLKWKVLQTVICLIGGMHLCRTEENRYSATLRSVLGGIEFILCK